MDDVKLSTIKIRQISKICHRLRGLEKCFVIESLISFCHPNRNLDMMLCTQLVEILSKGAFLLPCTCVFTKYSWKIHNKRWLKREEKTRENKSEYFSRKSFNPQLCMYSWGLKPSAPIQWMNDAKLCSSLHSKGSSHSMYIGTVSS